MVKTQMAQQVKKAAAKQTATAKQQVSAEPKPTEPKSKGQQSTIKAAVVQPQPKVVAPAKLKATTGDVATTSQKEATKRPTEAKTARVVKPMAAIKQRNEATATATATAPAADSKQKTCATLVGMQERPATPRKLSNKAKVSNKLPERRPSAELALVKIRLFAAGEIRVARYHRKSMAMKKMKKADGPEINGGGDVLAGNGVVA